VRASKSKSRNKGCFGNGASNKKKADTIRKLKRSLYSAEKRGNRSLAKSKRAILTMMNKNR
jgi:hypothetical protein